MKCTQIVEVSNILFENLFVKMVLEKTLKSSFKLGEAT